VMTCDVTAVHRPVWRRLVGRGPGVRNGEVVTLHGRWYPRAPRTSRARRKSAWAMNRSGTRIATSPMVDLDGER
jgi:hypothetical protein